MHRRRGESAHVLVMELEELFKNHVHRRRSWDVDKFLLIDCICVFKQSLLQRHWNVKQLQFLHVGKNTRKKTKHAYTWLRPSAFALRCNMLARWRCACIRAAFGCSLRLLFSMRACFCALRLSALSLLMSFSPSHSSYLLDQHHLVSAPCTQRSEQSNLSFQP